MKHSIFSFIAVSAVSMAAALVIAPYIILFVDEYSRYQDKFAPNYSSWKPNPSAVNSYHSYNSQKPYSSAIKS